MAHPRYQTLSGAWFEASSTPLYFVLRDAEIHSERIIVPPHALIWPQPLPDWASQQSAPTFCFHWSQLRAQEHTLCSVALLVVGEVSTP